jgi:hypothetical protein
VQGNGDPNAGVGVCLGITNFPADNQYQLCLSDQGDATLLPVGCKPVPGGTSASVCISHAASTTEAGIYYVRVQKLAGTNVALDYALFIQH